MTEISERISALRDWLTTENLDAIIIPHEDEYLGEYLPPQHERLAWITGFSGSAGVAIITQQTAAIFVDGRYSVQVTKQVPDSLFSYHHLFSDPPLTWAMTQLEQGSQLAIDPRLHSTTWYQQAQKQLNNTINLVTLEQNPIDILWQDRPQPIASEIRLLSLSYTGKSSLDKREMIASQLRQQNKDAVLLTQLDSICWLLNIRALDVPRFPVALCHAILRADASCLLFIHPERIPSEFSHHVGKGVEVLSQTELTTSLQALAHQRIAMDPQHTNAWFNQILTEAGAELVMEEDPCLLPKAIKNKVEAQGMIDCHRRDGAAMAKFLCWLDKEVEQEHFHDEAVLADQLQAYRQLDPTLIDLSFDTISAAGSNAAMCHYNHADQAQLGQLTPNSLYLVDSGGQYIDGTTDITRTIAIGDPSPLMKRQFTLVLKGHIALAQARFPQGTTGSQLDVLARQYLWQQGYNYDHGTGHGVGHCLSVHEGPQRISPTYHNVALHAGMVLSNEPGYYREEAFGIRIENLEIVIEADTKGDIPMLGFLSLTRCPIDVRAIDFSLLREDEMDWLNDYHHKVWEEISPLVDGEVKIWLEQATRAIS